jgi:hypothetical protein
MPARPEVPERPRQPPTGRTPTSGRSGPRRGGRQPDILVSQLFKRRCFARETGDEMASKFEFYGYDECVECGATYRDRENLTVCACGSKQFVGRDAARCLACGAFVDPYGGGEHVCEDGELDDYGFGD